MADTLLLSCALSVHRRKNFYRCGAFQAKLNGYVAKRRKQKAANRHTFFFLCLKDSRMLSQNSNNFLQNATRAHRFKWTAPPTQHALIAALPAAYDTGASAHRLGHNANTCAGTHAHMHNNVPTPQQRKRSYLTEQHRHKQKSEKQYKEVKHCARYRGHKEPSARNGQKGVLTFAHGW